MFKLLKFSVVNLVLLLVVFLESNLHRSVEGYRYGQNADFLEWPWQVLILTGPKDWNICGGSILNENYVLTAGHCVRDSEGQKPENYKLVFGEHDRSKQEGTELEIGVGEIIQYPWYETQNHSYDMALIKLKTPLNFNLYPYLRPVCLANHFVNLQGLRCVGTGWGRLGESGIMPNILQKLEMKYFPRKECAALHKHFYSRGPSYERVIKTHVCMVSKENQEPESGTSYGAVCNGDSGGPLQCRLGDVWYQVGVAWSNTDCTQNPSVFNLVYKYSDWIVENARYVPPQECYQLSRASPVAQQSLGPSLY